MKHHPLTTPEPDAFDSLLRAAVDISDVPLSDPPGFRPLHEGTALSGGRFRICRLLGRGGMGAVYEAEDRDARRKVALKVLSRVDPKRIKRFKDEFRILADTVHPHLVRLRDLFMEDGIWFFTMDLIEGGTLTNHLATVGPVRSTERERELRRLLSELADGVAAIHATGHLHRDLKPANVLVARDGGVVIVDFGLIGDFSNTASADGAFPVVGTASHMAPEQARGEPATTASDWYAVGTMAYEALTGRSPFGGAPSEILHRKCRSEVPELFTGEGPWPEELVELCRGLLAPEPALRPDYMHILRCLGSRAASRPRKGAEPGFVGRLNELATLGNALERAQCGALVVCRVSGAPGIGKTALVREFLDRATRERGAVVLTGRCYEREATPFKLLEGLVDSLSISIERRVPQARSALSPLSALFLGLSLDKPGQPSGGQTVTGAESRMRAVHAFRTGLRELETVGTVILHVDDVHWCDADGVGLFDEVLEAPAPPALVILTERDEEATDPLRALWRAKFLAHATVVEVHLECLSNPDVAEIVEAMAGRDHGLDIEAIVRESGGSPYFAAEMIRYALEQQHSGAPIASGVTLTLEDTILSRYRNLPDAAQRILEALSVCEGPTPLVLLEAATRVDDVDRAVAFLRSASFVRTRRVRDAPGVEPYHDRVREELQRALSESDRRALHLALAQAYGSLAPDAWDSMLHHFEGGGDFSRASHCAIRSAERAAEAQAFEQAASLYRRALRLGTWKPAEERGLYKCLAHALLTSGRNAEAAEAFERAGSMGPSAERAHLQLLCACALLSSGQPRRGLALLTETIGYLDVQIPEEAELFPRAAACIQQILVEAPRLVHRDGASLDRDGLLRNDAYFWAAGCLALIHHPAASYVSSVQLVDAIRLGEPTRIARGAYIQAIHTSVLLWDAMVPITEALMRIGDAAAAHSPSPTLRFWRDYSLAFQCYSAFDTDRTAAHVESAYEHASVADPGLEVAMAVLSTLEAIVLQARLDKPAALARCEIWKRDAIRRGDRPLMVWTRVLDSRWWMADEPEVFHTDLNALFAELTKTDYEDPSLIQTMETMLARVELYRGFAREAFARMTPVLELSRTLPSWAVPRQRVAVGVVYVPAAIAYAEASRCPVPPSVEAVLAEFPVETSGIIDLFRAAIANLAGDRSEALRFLERAEAEPGMERTRLVVFGARWARGHVIGGSEGGAMVREQVETLRVLGCANPERLLNGSWPGFRQAPP